MLHHLKGELTVCDAGFAVVDCGGVGYALTVSTGTSEKLSPMLGEEVFVFTHLQVREDGVELYGFGSREELEGAGCSIIAADAYELRDILSK